MSLFDLLQRVCDELPGCKLTSIVDVATGLPLASVGPVDRDLAAGADAFHSDLYRSAALALHELGATDPVENVVVQGSSTVFVSCPLGDSGFFWHVVTDSRTTLGFTQAMMRKHREAIEASTRELVQA